MEHWTPLECNPICNQSIRITERTAPLNVPTADFFALMAQSSFLGDGKLTKRESSGSVRLTRAEVAKHCTAGDCWVIVNDRVYDPWIVEGICCLVAHVCAK